MKVAYTKCDYCNKKIEDDEERCSVLYFWTAKDPYYKADMCSTCLKKFEEWLNTKKKVVEEDGADTGCSVD